jgi:hypothetical protein
MKRLYVVAVATGVLAVAAASAAVGLDKTLPYRIGLDDYSKYLWVGRWTVVSLALGVLALVSGLGSRKVLPFVLGLVGFCPLLLAGGVHSGPNPQAWCYINLRRIEGAKDQLAGERGLSNGTAVTLLDISRLLPGGQQLRCAKRGTYIINPMGNDARCTFHGSITEMEAEWQRQMQAQPGGPANRGQPVGSETNRASTAANPGG